MRTKEAEFTEIIDKNKDRIFRICCYYERNVNLRQDLYQEIIINIWKALDRFRGEAKMSSYVYRIAINIALKFQVEESKRKKESRLNDNSLNLESVGNETDADNVIEHEIQRLIRAVNLLKLPERTVISLLLEDFSYLEIAEITGLTKNNVGVKINRAKKKLRKIMGEDSNGL